jgi:hypothetical protein
VTDAEFARELAQRVQSLEGVTEEVPQIESTYYLAGG